MVCGWQVVTRAEKDRFYLQSRQQQEFSFTLLLDSVLNKYFIVAEKITSDQYSAVSFCELLMQHVARSLMRHTTVIPSSQVLVLTQQIKEIHVYYFRFVSAIRVESKKKKVTAINANVTRLLFFFFAVSVSG